MSSIVTAKQKLPLPALMHRLGLGEHAKKRALCPFHDDKRESFSVWERNGIWFFKCFTGCGDGDEINFLELHKGISRCDATKLFLEMAGVNGSASVNDKHLSVRSQPFDWRECVAALKGGDLVRLGNERWYSRAFCSWLHENNFVGFLGSAIAFPVHGKDGHAVAAHYRLENGEWRYFPKGIKSHPLVIGDAQPGDHIHIFESQFDAFAFMDLSGERSGIIATRGASNGATVVDLIPPGATVYLWPQNDAPGAKWERDVCSHTKCVVKSARTPAKFKDVNEWTKAGATDRELIDAMVKAEVLREPDKSWIDALNESVVTSSELHDLHLTPRRKLLDDWFCEGDLGFIFAFRGVGKTWFALGIAQALSTGGKLGDWQAHEPVSVLYIDGEMPPDLMRGRCERLEATNANLHFLNHEILFERAGRVLNIANAEVQQAITIRCVASGIKVLILDNLSTLASGMKENEADSWELVNNWLLDLRRRKIAVVIVHHAGRSGEMRGTSKREDNVFWIIGLDDTKRNADDKRGARFVSHFHKPSRNSQEDIPAVEWHFVTEPSGKVTISHKQAHTLDIFRQLIEAGVTECDQIAQEMKVPKYAVSRLAKKAMDAGWIDKKGREYVLVEGEK